MILIKPTVIKIVPTITCNPCKPVAQKKAEPNTLSAIVMEAWLYSKACKPVNIRANIIVNNVPKIAAFLLEANRAWCPYVIVAPEDSNNKVLSKGIAKGFKGSIPNGGHWPPISIAGDKLEWKKAQNIEKKSKCFTNNKKNNTINKSNYYFFSMVPK